MNATNRLVNRTLLLVVGAGLLFAGLLAIMMGARPVWAAPALAVAERWAQSLVSWIDTMSVSVLGTEVPGPVVVLTGTALVLTIVALAFLFTRGGGRTADVVRAEGNGDGRTIVDRSVADAVIAGALGGRADVLAARTDVYRVRRRPAVALTLVARKGASLRAVLAAAEGAVGEWDDLAGEQTPVLIHIADPRWRDALRTRSRVR